jgi:hypothetical protein
LSVAPRYLFAAAAHANTAHTPYTAFANLSAAQADAAAADVTPTGAVTIEAETIGAGGGRNVADGDVVVAPKVNDSHSSDGGDDGYASADSAAADGIADAGHMTLVSNEVTSVCCHLWT